jgi:3',5'-cyclic AMP phosphodiesterase CpdA
MRMCPGRNRGTPACAALLAAAALLACAHDVYRAGPLPPPGPVRPAAVRVLIFGDFGSRTIPQRHTARAIRRAHAAHPFDLAVQLGDNLYKCGPDPTRRGADGCRFADDGATVAPGVAPPDDPIFRVNEAPLEGLRAHDGGPLPMFLVLGNHDVDSGGRCAAKGLTQEEASRRRACLSVARRTPEWTMPARHYVIDRGPLKIIALDTNVVPGDYGGFTLDDEVAFLEDAVRGCAGRLCFIAGHHPPAAVHGYGRRGASRTYRTRMARLLAAADGKVLGYFAGHVHSLAHLSLGPLEVFVSGATAMGAFRPFTVRTPAEAQLRFATSAWGYTVLEADARGYAVRFFDTRGDPLHCCEGDAGGSCRPVRCE